MRSMRFLSFLLLITVLYACKNQPSGGKETTVPAEVKVVQLDGRYTLTVDGEPFYVKGAGSEFGNMEALAAHGANSLRTWRTDNGLQTGQEVLDKAHENGLMVCMGIEIGRERHGFDYNDPVTVREQLSFVREEVLKYKDHPALLAWGIGNELNLKSSNPAVWDAVNDIAAMIKKIDPNHPTTTMLAGFNKELGELISTRCPDLDFLSFQFYADIVNLPKYLSEANYTGPYLITEWGATGHWESPVTEWGRPIEQTSREKAEAYKYRYENVIAADPERCMGSFVFLWGQKQERTPTWYGMFLENGDETASVDVMHYLWNDKWPDNQTPELKQFLMNEKDAYSSVTVAPGVDCFAQVSVTDPDGDPLQFTWEIIPEVPEEKQSEGGDFEPRPDTVVAVFETVEEGSVKFSSPVHPGEYRLFVYVSDGHGHSATANIPFLVK